MGKPTTSNHASSPVLSPSTQPILLRDLQKVLVEINRAVGKLPDSTNLSEESSEPKKPRVRASKVEYTAVNEM
jgi:hypothetical protein